MTGALRDLYMLEFLDLPEPYKEYDLKKAILKNMKRFLLEFGRDFLFIDEEYHVQVGNNDYYVDLLFYHRELQCLVAIDLKYVRPIRSGESVLTNTESYIISFDSTMEKYIDSVRIANTAKRFKNA